MKKIFLALIFGFILFIFLTITLAVMVVPVKAYTGSTIGSEEETMKVYMPMVLSPMGRTSRNTVSVPVTVPTPLPTMVHPTPTVQPTPVPTNIPVDPTEEPEPECGEYSQAGPHPCPGGSDGEWLHKGPGFPDPTP